MGELDDALAAGQPGDDMAEDMVFDAKPEVLTFEHSEDGRVLHYVAWPLVQEIISAGSRGSQSELAALTSRIREQL